ncbi:MAG: class IV adenylate cyclase [Candidatus Paceibacterota bacterium]|jgi:adenylate cyclase class 2
MANNLIETEVKFKIQDLSELEGKIKSAEGKELHRNIFQRTIRMDTPEESLIKRGVFLRVRDGEKKIITVKSKLPESDKNFKEREELEIEISDVPLAEKIFFTLGFTEKWIMEKYRTEYELAGTILALDHLLFGDYLEIEGDKDSIEKAIKILGLEKETRITKTYWHLFENYKKKNNLNERNIVF